MNTAPAIDAKGLGKAYRVFRRPIDSLLELFLGRTRSETFWAVRDVTLELPAGASLGVVGDNGAGKSTFLRLLAGAIPPTTGALSRNGRLAANLSLGAGFHPDLTGRENIRIGCAIQGLSPEETAAIEPEVARFSELGTFLDRPARTYSAGMNLRLGFSVSTSVRPDILLLDEHLAVGDAHFQHKCLRRIMSMRESGCTLVFCSHNLYAIDQVCERSLWLRDGQVAALGPTRAVLDAYRDHVRARDAETPTEIRAPRPARPLWEGAPDGRILDASLEGEGGDGTIETGQCLKLRVRVRLSDRARRDGAHLVVLVVRNDAVWCFGGKTETRQTDDDLHSLGDDQYGSTLVVDNMPLLAGQYTFTVALMDARTPHPYDYRVAVAPFSVRDRGAGGTLVRVPVRWERPV